MNFFLNGPYTYWFDCIIHIYIYIIYFRLNQKLKTLQETWQEKIHRPYLYCLRMILTWKVYQCNTWQQHRMISWKTTWHLYFRCFVLYCNSMTLGHATDSQLFIVSVNYCGRVAGQPSCLICLLKVKFWLRSNAM